MCVCVKGNRSSAHRVSTGEGSKKSAKGKATNSQPDPKDRAHSGATEGQAEDTASGERGGGEGKVRSSEAKGKKGAGAGAGGGGERTVCDGCGDSLKSTKVAGDKTSFSFREHGGKR